MLENRDQANRMVGFASGERPKGDFYATPPVATEALLGVETFQGSVLEPCCGDGAISKILEARGLPVVSRDLYSWGYGQTGVNFLNSDPGDFDAVVTNPPFKLSTEFTLQALRATRAKLGKVAILNRLQWLEGIKRRRLLFESPDAPFARVHVFSKRIPRMNRFDFTGKPSTSVLAFAWFIWDWKIGLDARLGGVQHKPTVGWI